jgi:hypothetical protein
MVSPHVGCSRLFPALLAPLNQVLAALPGPFLPLMGPPGRWGGWLLGALGWGSPGAALDPWGDRAVHCQHGCWAC